MIEVTASIVLRSIPMPSYPYGYVDEYVGSDRMLNALYAQSIDAPVNIPVRSILHGCRQWRPVIPKCQDES